MPDTGVSTILPETTGSAALDAYTKASLGALNKGVDYTQTPAYKTLLELLGPGADGGLNPSLDAQYKAGSKIIGQQTAENAAMAKSGVQGRGLGQSSIEAQAVENAGFQGTMANSALLGSWPCGPRTPRSSPPPAWDSGWG